MAKFDILKPWKAQQKTQAPPAHSDQELINQIETISREDGNPISGITILTGNASANEDQKAVVRELEQVARTMKLKTTPVLFLYDQEITEQNFMKGSRKLSPASANAVSGMTEDGTPIIGIAASTFTVLKNDKSATQPLLARIVGLGAHETGHIKHPEHSTNVKKLRDNELEVDQLEAKATCNPRAFGEALTALDRDDAQSNGQTLQQYYADKEKSILAGDTAIDHHLTPTRLAHLHYIEAHPSKECRPTKQSAPIKP